MSEVRVANLKVATTLLVSISAGYVVEDFQLGKAIYIHVVLTKTFIRFFSSNDPARDLAVGYLY